MLKSESSKLSSKLQYEKNYNKNVIIFIICLNEWQEIWDSCEGNNSILFTLHFVVHGISPSRTTARLQHKNHFRFRLTQLLLLFYDLLSTTCNPLRFQQPTPPVPDEVSILKLLHLATYRLQLVLVDRQASGLTDWLFFILRHTADSIRHTFPLFLSQFAHLSQPLTGQDNFEKYLCKF